MINSKLVLAHPREFVMGFSLYYPLDEELLSRYEDVWDWRMVSRNKSIRWTAQLMEKFQDRWNWGYLGLSSNESLPWSEELLRRFENRWSWYHLGWLPEIVNQRSTLQLCFRHWTDWHQKNLFSVYEFMPAISHTEQSWAAEVFENWKDLNWSLFSHYTGFPWSVAFIEKHKNRLDWKALSGNLGLPWSRELILKYRDRWHWSSLSYCKAIPWDAEMLEELADRIHWSLLSANQDRPWDVALLSLFHEKLQWVRARTDEGGGIIGVEGLLHNRSIVWGPELFHLCTGTISHQFKALVEEAKDSGDDCPVLTDEQFWTVHLDCATWTVEFLEFLLQAEDETGVQHIDWSRVAIEFFLWEKMSSATLDRCLHHIDGNLLAGNASFPWNENLQLLERLSVEPDETGDSGWDRLSYNKGLRLSTELIERYLFKWNWKLLSYNSSLTIEMIRAFEGKWDWPSLLRNAAIGVDLVRHRPAHWNDWWKEYRDPPFKSIQVFQALAYLDAASPVHELDRKEELKDLLFGFVDKPLDAYRQDFLNGLANGDFDTLVPAITHDHYLPLLQEFADEIASRRWSVRFFETMAFKAYTLIQQRRFTESIDLFKLALQLELKAGSIVNDLSPFCNALFVLQNDNTGLPINVELNHRFLERCLPFAPKNPAIYFNAACLYAEMNDVDKVFECIGLAKEHRYGEFAAMIDAIRKAPIFSAVVKDSRFSPYRL